MRNLKDEWFESADDKIAEVELRTMKQNDYLKVERQLEIEQEIFLRGVTEEEKIAWRKFLNKYEELIMLRYNIMMKNVAIAVKFEDI